MENGHIGDTTIAGNNRSTRRRAYNGRLVAYIQPMGNQKLSIHATSPSLKTD
jgi:hypothetical protein